MLEVLLVMGLPTLIFGVFALLALWFGAETRPWFDERPVLDERPNWGPIRRSVPRDEDEDDEDPPDGTAVPVPAPVRGQPRPAAATRAAMSPSGV
ncbi:MAG: hypothetical protein V7607_4648 [Solirubrobacteraceae bacterium]